MKHKDQRPRDLRLLLYAVAITTLLLVVGLVIAAVAVDLRITHGAGSLTCGTVFEPEYDCVDLPALRQSHLIVALGTVVASGLVAAAALTAVMRDRLLVQAAGAVAFAVALLVQLGASIVFLFTMFP